MINKWRCVRSLDDGAYEYQCLMCTNTWAAITAPGYSKWDTKEYVTTWSFCPYCGAHWEGTVSGYYERALGPRRERIEKAYELQSRQYSKDYKAYRARMLPPFWWVIEERTYWPEYAEDDKMNRWIPKWVIRGLKYPVRQVLYFLREQRKELRHGMFNTVDQLRLVKYPSGCKDLLTASGVPRFHDLDFRGDYGAT